MDTDEALGVVDNINSLMRPLMVAMIIPAFVLAMLICRKLSTGYVLKGMPLPMKTSLGVTSIIMVGFVIAIMDGYKLRKEQGYLREQKYKVQNPLSVFGSIVTQRDEDFIKDNISKFKGVLPTFKSENTFPGTEESEIIKSDDNQTPEKSESITNWEVKP
ncbi:MAG: hypothetical protein F9K48_11270 [Candidatus Brocadia sp.]|nr:MAG: hypothetical protein F9K48_11270 [Candidatus Brocadia sp.]